MPGVTLGALLLVGLGGAAGSILRYLATMAGFALFGTGFPWGTLAVNILGSAAIGAIAAAGLEGHLRMLLVAGFLGGFTTFSAYSLETTLLWERAPPVAVLYAVLSVALGVAACLAGAWMVRR
ncbi:CrcB family protein [Roseomonas sp. HF4]|uniref:fluoride efflux transporter FluC n=1 Tax=Roseomonas sp. HF4 TaxID=2562313 RepID=UPI0010C078AA|nr:CrcB family protein [Roseomonas sp. HF4]